MAIAHPTENPLHPESWSGTPAGIAAGLRSLGADVVGVAATPPRPLRRPIELLLTGSAAIAHARRRGQIDRSVVRDARELAMLSPLLARARTVAAPRRVAERRPLDAVIQIGCDFQLPRHERLVTFDDMTVVQMLEPQTADQNPPWNRVSHRTARAWRHRQQKIYGAARACAAATHWVTDSLTRDYGVPVGEAVVAGLGANLQPRRLSKDWNSPTYLFVGVNWARKNGDAVLRSFQQVREQYPAATLDVVGGHPRIDLDGVTGHGMLPHHDQAAAARLIDLFERATCLVMPSLHEAAGIAYIEAGTAGVPSIGTDRGGSRTLIGRGGVIVDPFDPSSITTAMLELAVGDYAREAGSAAHDRSRFFTWELVARRLLDAVGLAQPDGAPVPGVPSP